MEPLQIKTDADMQFTITGIKPVVYCPQCDEQTTQAELNKYDMCRNCDRQACPECGQAFCSHNYS